ncbi:unnamed protein product [Mytilus coruscus]|uniref:NCAM n=1 Tax=Mytilus coruscus TaxID=42192 RepID=A0A6J8EU77_MYTCO|nr:unnamed protein product [Mytilus coruscus]
MTGANIRFANEGETMQLNCPYNKVNSWQSGTNDFLVVCEGEIPMINMNLSISNRINISSDCTTLTITNFSKEDAGITITEANGTLFITRNEGDLVNLTCTVEGAMQDEKLIWISENSVQSSGGTNGYIIKTFVAQRSDNKKEFTCVANNSVNTLPLKASVRLNLILKPRIKIISSRNPVITIGQRITLTCRDENEKTEKNIDVFLWIHNGVHLPNKTENLLFENANKSIAGQYACIVESAAGRDSAFINITVNYSPVVQNTTVTLFASSRPRTLECSVLGVPDVYNFSAWQHYTYNNELVRSLDGNTNGTLTLQNKVSMHPFYEDSGIYSCCVTNGVPDELGNFWQTGTINVTIEGKPELAKPHNNNYIGHLYAKSFMRIFVLSSSKVSATIWITEIKERQEVTPCIPSVAVTQFFGKPVNTTGFICEFQIQNTTLKDFQNYTVDVENKCGKNTFKIALILTDFGKPEKPKGVVIYSSSKYIFLQWQSGLNDGSRQSFIIQYRKRSSSDWEYLKAENSNSTNHSIYILNLEPSTKYEVRMYASNELGNSTYTKRIISTKKEKSNENKSYWTEFLLVLVVIIPVCIIIIWWRLKKEIYSYYCIFCSSHRANDDYIQEEGGAIENNLYQAANDLIQQPSVSSNREDDAYSSIDRRQQVVHEQNVTYQISKRDQKETQDQQQRSMNNGLDPQNLNYVEVMFDNTTNNGAFCIHGADARTPYADIDFSAKADPLIILEKNEESLSSHSVENDDFVSLEEVQQWMISKE